MRETVVGSPLRGPSVGLVAAVLFVPVFIHVGPGGSIGLGESNLYILKTPGADLPLSFFLGPALAGVALGAWGWPPRVGLGAQLAGWYAATQLVAVGVGSILGTTDLTSLVFCYQALVPLPWLVVGERLAALDPVRRDRFLAAALAAPVLAGAVFVGLTLAGAAADPRIGVVDTLGPIVNSKALRYFPTVLVVACWYHAERRSLDGRCRPWLRPLGAAALTVAAAYGVFGHSRSSYLLFAAFAATAFLARARRDLAATSALLAAAAILSVGAVTYVATAERLPRSLERWTGADDSANVSSERHWTALTGGVLDGASAPLGRMYAADVAENLAGVERGTGQVANSESQFSETALRSGPLGLLPLLALTVAGSLTALRGLVRLDESQWSQRWAFTTFLVLWPVSGLVQLNLTEAYVAPLAWMAAGLTLGFAPTESPADPPAWSSTTTTTVSPALVAARTHRPTTAVPA